MTTGFGGVVQGTRKGAFVWVALLSTAYSREAGMNIATYFWEVDLSSRDCSQRFLVEHTDDAGRSTSQFCACGLRPVRDLNQRIERRLALPAVASQHVPDFFDRGVKGLRCGLVGDMFHDVSSFDEKGEDTHPRRGGVSFPRGLK